MKKLVIFPVIFFCLGCFAQPGAVVDSTIATKDNSMFSESNNSNGAGVNLFAGRNGQGNFRRAALKFSVLSNHPDSFKSISIRILINQVSNTSLRTVALHKLTSDWGEGSSNSTSGAGAPPSTNDATWNFRFFNTLSWGTAGGDYEPIPSAILSVGDLGYYTFSSAGLLADYKSWISNPSSNFGWVIIGDETVNNSAKRFDSRESLAANAPKIFATYNPAVLPVVLSDFKAYDKESFIRLSWQTSSEINNVLFIVEHSKDGRNFSEIRRMPGAGNSSRLLSYFFDHFLFSTDNFYRIAMVDINGLSRYSPVVFLKTRKQVRQLTVMPNPAGNFIRIPTWSSSVGQQYVIYNGIGAIVNKGTLAGDIIDIQKLLPGNYYIELNFNGEALRSAFIKQ